MSEVIGELELLTKDFISEKYGLSGEEARRFAVDFSLVACSLQKETTKFLALASAKSISPVTMFYCLATCYKCSLAEEEGEPIATGLLLADLVRVSAILPEDVEVTLPKGIHISDWNKVRDASLFVDGKTAVMVVNKSSGIVEAYRNLGNFVSGNRDIYCEITSKIGDCIALLVVKSCKCFRAYVDGSFAHQVILRRRLGDWVSRDLKTLAMEISGIASTKGIASDVVNAILLLSVKLSEQGLGAAFVMGESTEIRPRIAHERRVKSPMKILDMDELQLIRDVSTDGAAILGKTGELESVSVKFNAEGGRKLSTIDITKSAQAVMGIVVSEDAIVSVIVSGEVVKEL